MKRIKLVFGICILYLFVVFGGTGLMMYLDNKFYGNVQANEIEIQDDSEWHYNAWMQWKAEIAEKAKYRVVFVFPQEDKTTKLVVVHDPVWDVFCYTLQNKPYYFKTGLNCFPRWVLEGCNRK